MDYDRVIKALNDRCVERDLYPTKSWNNSDEDLNEIEKKKVCLIIEGS